MFRIPFHKFLFLEQSSKNELAPVEIISRGSSSFPSRVEASVLSRSHPDVDQDDDEFHRMSYAGGKKYLDADFLFTHEKERSPQFEERKKRSYFYNYCRPIIDSYLYFLFKSNPTRVGKEAIKKSNMLFIADPSKGVEDLNGLMKNHASELLKVGRAWFRMDAPTIPPSSAKEEEERANLPYVYAFKPENILDWAEGEEGTLLWVKAIVSDEPKQAFDYQASQEKVIKIWTADAIAVYTLDGLLVGTEVNTLGLVPFLLTRLNDTMQSFIADIAIINRALYNWCSLLDEILYKQTFSQMVVPGDKTQRLAEKRVGVAAAFTFDPASKHAPHFIFPDPRQAEMIQKQVDLAIMEIYRAANLEWVDSKRATNKSGSAKSFDFQNTNKVLGGIAASLENTEAGMFKMLNVLCGRGGEEFPKAQYPRDFSVAALESELSNIFFGLSRQISAHLDKLLKKRAAVLLMPRLEDKDKAIIDKEIDAVEEEPPEIEVNERIAQLASSAANANVVGSTAKQIKDVV